MNTLSLHIEYLLQRHECVTLPGLGALLVHGVAPVYDVERARWVAPARAVSFNPDIVRTDGLLAQSVARREGISHQQAAQKVETWVTELKRGLEAGQGVKLGHVGRLAPTAHGTLSFEPSADWTKRVADVMWLPDVAIKPCGRQAAERGDEDVYLPSRRRAVLGMIGRAAACIAVLFALGWVVADNIRSGNQVQYASVTPIEPKSMIEQPGEAKAPIVWHLRHHADAVVDVEPRPERKAVVNYAPGYYLIVASLASEKEAAKFMAQYPGEHLGVLRADGRYRVYAAAAPTAGELYAAAAAPDFSAKFASSWVCRR